MRTLEFTTFSKEDAQEGELSFNCRICKRKVGSESIIIRKPDGPEQEGDLQAAVQPLSFRRIVLKLPDSQVSFVVCLECCTLLKAMASGEYEEHEMDTGEEDADPYMN